MCKPEPNDRLESLKSVFSETLQNLTVDGVDIKEFLQGIDTQEDLKISVDINVPNRIREAQNIVQNSQFRVMEGCYKWVDGQGWVKVSC